MADIIRYTIFTAFLILACTLYLSLITHHPNDAAWTSAVQTQKLHNWAGLYGAYYSDITFTLFGRAAWLIPLLLIVFAYQLIVKKKMIHLTVPLIATRLGGVLLFLFTFSALLDLSSASGGVIGNAISSFYVQLINFISRSTSVIIVYSGQLLFALLALIGLTLASGAGPIRWADYFGDLLLTLKRKLFRQLSNQEPQISRDGLASVEHLMQRPDPKGNDRMEEAASQSNVTSDEQPDLTEPILEETTPYQEPQFNDHETLPPFSALDDQTPLFEPEDKGEEEIIAPHSTSSESLQSPSEDSLHFAAEEEQEQIITPPDKVALELEPATESVWHHPKPSNKEERARPIETLDEEEFPPLPPVNPFERKERLTNWLQITTQEPTPLVVEETPSLATASEEHAPGLFDRFKLKRTKRSKEPKFFDASFLKTERPPFNPLKSIENSEELHQEPTHYDDPIISFSADEPTMPLAEPPSAIERDGMRREPTLQHFNDESSSPFNLFAVEEGTTADSQLAPLEEESSTEPIGEPLPFAFEPVVTPEIVSTQPLKEEQQHEDTPPSLVEPLTLNPPTFTTNNPSALQQKPDTSQQEVTDSHYPMKGRLPSLDLLGNPPPKKNLYEEGELRALGDLIEEQLQHYNVSVRVVDAEPGPIITRFSLELAPGVKVAQINTLSKDIARALSVTNIRVEDIIPGTPYVGLEVPNARRETVHFKDGLASKEYRQEKNPLTMILGQDISGQHVISNLQKMPHLLVAGTTGSGKSVGINTMLLSLLYKALPEDLRLILIDPKMLELSVYNDIPHLLTPVITDMNESANALRWCVAEMEHRYHLLSQLKVRNIQGFNEKVLEHKRRGTPLRNPLYNSGDDLSEFAQDEYLEKLPYIVIVIDEFADMMMMVGKKCEELIARLTQKARAAGIHLIIATQRPSVDVITGLIKSNVPSRIAFQVSSRIDSRTILDQQGAETLLGNGDMLYLPIGESIPQRVHGAFISDHEVNKIVEFLKLTGAPNYIEGILTDPTEPIPGLSEEASGVPDDESDPLYDEAVRIVIETRRASVSYLQRRLRIGFNRASRIMDEMERNGFVSPPEGNGSREVLIAAASDDVDED